MRLNIGSGTALRGLRFLLVSSLAMGLHTAHAAAGLDFGYRIDGPADLRPTLVFNDGEDTYIQPSANARASVPGAYSDGPYLRLSGIPDSFTVRVGSLTLHVQHSRLPSGPTSVPVSASPSTYEEPAMGMHAMQPVHVQPEAMLPVVSNATKTAPVLTNAVMKPATPNDTSGNVPPIIGGPIAASTVMATAIPAPASSGVVASTAAPAKKDPPDVSYLAKDFGADGIRDGFGGSIQIHFRSQPSADIQFASADGKHLDSSFDASSNVMTVSAAQKFVVRDGHSSVVVSREIADTFHYQVDNAAGLNRVFAEAGATYFEVAEGTKKVTVRADGKVLPGQQKGRYYRVTGTGDTFDVDADGFDVTVTRTRAVRYTDREGSAS